MVHHDGEDDASQAGSGYRHAQGQGTTVVKPCGHRGRRGEEDRGRSRSAANRLREDELVIFRGDRGHHEAENVEEASEYQEPPGPEAVKQSPENRSLFPLSVTSAFVQEKTEQYGPKGTS